MIKPVPLVGTGFFLGCVMDWVKERLGENSTRVALVAVGTKLAASIGLVGPEWDAMVNGAVELLLALALVMLRENQK